MLLLLKSKLHQRDEIKGRPKPPPRCLLVAHAGNSCLYLFELANQLLVSLTQLRKCGFPKRNVGIGLSAGSSPEDCGADIRVEITRPVPIPVVDVLSLERRHAYPISDYGNVPYAATAKLNLQQIAIQRKADDFSNRKVPFCH